MLRPGTIDATGPVTDTTLAPREDRDAIHILPLSIIPIKTRTLREARLVKNSKLQGTVELFSEGNAGSGQLLPEQLTEFFDFDDDRLRDLELVTALSALPSYDVYSLRLELRELGIKVEDHKQLKLSSTKARELSSYMNTFTRPLVARVYGDGDVGIRTLEELVKLFLDPNMETARRNLSDLANSLGIELIEIPAFLERYADVYLSLAYYSEAIDQIKKPVQQLTDVLAKVRRDPRFGTNRPIIKACERIEARIIATESEISGILEAFRLRTGDMWRDINGQRFRVMEQLIMDCHRSMGGNICGLVVKMDAWSKLPGKGSLGNCVQFIMSDLAAGIESMPPLNVSMSGDEKSDHELEWVA